MINVKVTSDLHGYLPDMDEFDLLLICGDVCPTYTHGFDFQREWIMEDFVEWVKGLPFKHSWSKVVMTPGNHDFVFERWEQFDYDLLNYLTEGRLIVLRNRLFEFNYLEDNDPDIKTLKIWGTPYCQVFGNWAFMRPSYILRDKFDDIPNDIDILISHSAPDIEGYGYVDWDTPYQRNAGCPVLARAIKDKKPKFVFCGHIHSGNHKLQDINGTMIANVSYVDEAYEPTNNILNIYL